MEVPITVRDLEPEDLPDLDWTGGPEHLQAIARDLSISASGGLAQLVVALPADRLIGFGGVDFRTADRSGTIWMLSVHDAWQSLGVGTLLIKALERADPGGRSESGPDRRRARQSARPGPLPPARLSGVRFGAGELADRRRPALRHGLQVLRGSCPERAIGVVQSTATPGPASPASRGRRYTARVSTSLVFAALLVTGIAAWAGWPRWCSCCSDRSPSRDAEASAVRDPGGSPSGPDAAWPGWWVNGRGPGRGSYPGMEDFEFGQQVDFAHNGENYLHYLSQTFELDENGAATKPLSMETGFWRPQPDGTIEVVLGPSRRLRRGLVRQDHRRQGRAGHRRDRAHRHRRGVQRRAVGCTDTSRVICSGRSTRPRRSATAEPPLGSAAALLMWEETPRRRCSSEMSAIIAVERT